MVESFIYRFRSADALLDGFHELEKQEIYFASRSELNDALEGFKDLFWRGDIIVWTNLLRHYLLCLLQAVLRTLEDEAGYELTAETLPVGIIAQDLHPEVQAVYQRLCKQFLEDEELGTLPGLLTERSTPVRRNELLSLLWLIHSRALKLVYTCLSPESPIHAMDSSLRSQVQRPLRLKQSLAACEQLAGKRIDAAELIEAMCAAQVSAIAQTNFILAYNAANQLKGTAWKVISSTFPEVYLNGLEKLLYQDWYAACFVGNPSDAAMWGYYGNGHRGVCLKFRTSALAGGKPGLPLHCVVGMGGSAKDGSSSTVKGVRTLELNEVQYNEKYPAIDFFRALGVLTPAQAAFWFMNEDSGVSKTGVDLLQQDDTWRQQYWEGFHKTTTTKLKDWQHEREYRITLQSMIADLSQKAARKLQYRFEDLHGIVFGIKTPLEQKLAMVRIVQQKCKESNRRDFEISQAYYSPQTGRIVEVPWRLVTLG